MSTMLRTNGHSSTSWSVSTLVPTIRSSTGPTSHSHKPASRYHFLFFFSFPGTCSLWNILLNFWRDLLKLFEKLGWPRNWSSGIFTNRALSSLKTLKESFIFDNMNSAKYLSVSKIEKHSYFAGWHVPAKNPSAAPGCLLFSLFSSFAKEI